MTDDNALAYRLTAGQVAGLDHIVARRGAADDVVSAVRLLSPADVAARCNIGVRTVYRAIEDGELMASRLRARLRIEPSACEAWLAASRVTATRPSVNPILGAPRRGAVRGALSRILDPDPREA